MLRGQRDGSLRMYSRFSRPEPLLFLPSSSSVVLMRLRTPFQTHYFSENLVAPGLRPRSLFVLVGSQARRSWGLFLAFSLPNPAVLDFGHQFLIQHLDISFWIHVIIPREFSRTVSDMYTTLTSYRQGTVEGRYSSEIQTWTSVI
jgi:hypothetical protein